MLMQYSWPGNVQGTGKCNRARDHSYARYGTDGKKPAPAYPETRPYGKNATSAAEPVSLFDAEKQLILKTLTETEGNKSEASRRLGITRKTLQSKLNRYERSGMKTVT